MAEFYEDPAVDIDVAILRSLPAQRVTVKVQPVRHSDGLAWHWLDAIGQVRSECPACRPGVSCWRHVGNSALLMDLAGGFVVGKVTGNEGCQGKACWPDRPAQLPPAGVFVRKTRGGEWSMCAACATEALGPVIDSEAVTP